MARREASLILIFIFLIFGAVYSIALPFILKLPLTAWYSIFLLASGAILLIAAYGIWNLKLWGFVLVIVWYTLNIILSLIKGDYLGIIIPIIILLYLISKRKIFH